MRIQTQAETYALRVVAADTSYRYENYGREVPGPDYGKAMHELHANPRYYDPQGQHTDPEALKAVMGTGGDPEAPVSVYRALPHGRTDLNQGDWVSPSLPYVKEWGNAAGRSFPILHTKVPAKHLYTDRSSMQEWAYHGPDTTGQVL